MSMISRLGAILLLSAVAVALVAAGTAQSTSRSGVYTIQGDPRMCPSPVCGGYWVALANGARTHCADGSTAPRCYVARAVDASGRTVEVAAGGLVRARLELSETGDFRDLGIAVVSSTYAPAGTGTVTGGYYRLADTGIRCILAPCFSYTATQLNGSTRTMASELELASSGATRTELARATSALRAADGLLARGRFARTREGGRVFRASRLFLRAPLPRA
jgi:hypothetical protein